MKKKFKLTIFPAIDRGFNAISFEFDSVAEMMAAKNSCADLLLFLQDDLKVMRDYSNGFEVEEFIDGEWEEYENWEDEE